MAKPIYLDYMATTPCDPRIKEKMLPYLTDIFGNPSSKHYYGLEAKETVEKARNQVANLINVKPENIIWTSGATEANNLAIKGAVDFYKRQGKHIITSKIEHKSVLETCKYLEGQGFEVTYLTPNTAGIIETDKLEKALRPDTILISIMHVNNETGVIQNIKEIGSIVRSKGILFHIDAAQSAGKIPIDLQNLNVDLASFSAHKIYGPKGIGALYIRPKLHLVPLIHGGTQENGLRAGTLATHQIVGMGEAFQTANLELNQEAAQLLKLRKKLWQGIKELKKIHLNGSLDNRIPGNLNISFEDIDGELLTSALKDIAVSSVAACTRTDSEPSYILKAMGLPQNIVNNSIRISLGRFTTEKEIDFTINKINEVVKKLREE